MVMKLVPLENKQSSQIGILEELAISLVAFLVPTSNLTGLIALMLASKSTFLHGDFDCGLTLSQYQKTSTCCTVSRRLPSSRTRGIF